MSRSRWNGDACECCGVLYADLRTGLTFGDVRAMLWSKSKDSREWRYKRRRTVLGLWHQIKRSMWREHLEMCDHYCGR
jgi:hypothetical protein